MGNASTSILGALASGTKVAALPWPRVIVDAPRWDELAKELGQGAWTLLSLWGDRDQVHMALAGEGYTEIAVATLPCPGGRFPSVGRWHAPALRLERAIGDLHGLVADGAPDPRPWLDHGKWPAPPPQRVTPAPSPQPYDFLHSEGEGLHQIPVGPVHAGIIEPGHFRFTANGETVVRLEERLGYVHKGIDALLVGAPLSRAARLAARVSGDSTVAYGIAFARAVEAAANFEIPRRAHWLRALMGELERLANHLGDIGAICNDASFALMQAHCTIYREKALRLAEASFGHRLMMDRVIPGGVSVDLDSAGAAAARALVAEIRRRFPELMELYDNTASLQDRTVATGIAAPELVRRFGCGGYIGRASGRNADMRRAPAYPPYPELSFTVPVRDDGDVNARVWIRMHEVQQSLGLIEQIVDTLPAGSRCADFGVIPADAEGAALVEGFRGDVFAWVRFGSEGTIARCHLRDPSWFQWPVLEAAIEGNIVADFPLCNKSFNCSYSGHDL